MNPEIKAALEQVREALPRRSTLNGIPVPNPHQEALDLITEHLERQEARGWEMEAPKWPVIALGQGKIGVHPGELGDRKALIFSTLGTGIVGDECPGGGYLNDNETLCVITFGNKASLQAMFDELVKVAAKMEAPHE